MKMKLNLLLTALLMFFVFTLPAQNDMDTGMNAKMNNEDIMLIDLMMDSSYVTPPVKYKNIVSVGARYYYSTLDNTRELLAANGFGLEPDAWEFQVKLYNLPKLYYYHQLGTLINGRYVSVSGVGVKQDLRHNLIKNSSFFFTPYLELGAGYYRMNLIKEAKSTSITSILTSSVETNHVDNFVITGDIGLELGVGFKLDNTRLRVQINGGYLTNVPTEWRLAGSLAFKEKINLASPYVGAKIGIDLSDSYGSGCCSF